MYCTCCGNDRFLAKRMAYTGVIADGEKEILENLDTKYYVDYADEVCGPYVCLKCKTEYEELKEGRQPLNMVPAGITGDSWMNTNTHTIYEPADRSLISYDDQGARIVKTGCTKKQVLEEMQYYIIARLYTLGIAGDYTEASKIYKDMAVPDRFSSDEDVLHIAEGYASICLKDYTEHIQIAKNKR